MKTKIYKKDEFSFSIRKESGNLHTKDIRTNKHKPVMYAAYYDGQESLGLKNYMNLTSKSIGEAVEDLRQDGLVLVGNRFNISFFDEEAVELFIEMLGAVEKVF